jgi:hypothetical protein
VHISSIKHVPFRLSMTRDDDNDNDDDDNVMVTLRKKKQTAATRPWFKNPKTPEKPFDKESEDASCITSQAWISLVDKRN